MAPHLGLAWAKALSGLGEWLNCVPFAWWPQHGQTSSVTGMGSGTHGVPTSDICLGRHQHQATFLHHVWRCLYPAPAFWQWWFWLYDSHTSDSVVHVTKTTTTQKHHKHCNYMSMHPTLGDKK